MTSNNQTAHLKKEILVRLINSFLSGRYEESSRLIPYDMRPKGADVPFRCCIYKERAILKDRVIAGMGFAIEADDEKTLLSAYARRSLQRAKLEDNNFLTVLEAACRGCVPNRIYVTDICQGCVARACQTTCKFGAISIIQGKSVIDSAKCKNCKMCISACPYNAIVKIAVPCEDACPVKAINKNTQGLARIDFTKCIACGRCVSACPFGAVHEKSQIIDILKNMQSGQKVIALIAPSIAGQFPGNIYQLKTALLQAGFSAVHEVAQGADITTQNEAKEFLSRMQEGQPFMTTSCCAGYKELAQKHLPEIIPFMSDTQTPLYYIAEKIKTALPAAVTVFIGPCVAKRAEGLRSKQVDYVMNYEELGALLVAKKIEILNCAETKFEQESSRQGRNFGFSSGVSEAIQTALGHKREMAKPALLDGLNKETIRQLKKMAVDGKCPDGNLLEVMCCAGGCVAGNSTLNTPKLAKKTISDFTAQSQNIEPVIF